MSKQDQQTPRKKPNALQDAFSTASAAFGVQSNKNRERDFSGGSIYTFMIAGLTFTAIFIVVMVVLVRTVLSSAGL